MDYLWIANAKIYNDSVIVLWDWIINVVLHTLICWTMLGLIVVVFLVYDGQRIHSEYTGKTNWMCRFVCLRTSYYSQRLSIRFASMLASGKFFSCEAVIKLMRDIYLCIWATNPMKIPSWVLRSQWGVLLKRGTENGTERKTEWNGKYAMRYS